MEPIGGNKGGSAIDEAFHELLENTFGPSVIETFHKKYKKQYMGLLREFEAQKRGKECDVRLNLPPKLMGIYDNAKEKGEPNIHIDETKLFFIDKDNDEIVISKDLFLSMFEESQKCISESMSEILGNDKCKDVKTFSVLSGVCHNPG